jgi:hypothetical protein
LRPVGSLAASTLNLWKVAMSAVSSCKRQRSTQVHERFAQIPTHNVHMMATDN